MNLSSSSILDKISLVASQVLLGDTKIHEQQQLKATQEETRQKIAVVQKKISMLEEQELVAAGCHVSHKMDCRSLKSAISLKSSRS